MKKLLLSIASILLAAGLFAQEVTFSGDLNTAWGLTAPWTSEAWDFDLGKIDFTGGIEAYMDKSTAFVEASIGYDFTQFNLDWSINEAYIDYSDSLWGLRIGRQKWAWGKADGVNITNCVFPEDSTSLFNDDSSFGVDALRLSLYGNSFTVDAMWIPFFRGTSLPLDDSNPLKKYVIPSSYTISIPAYNINQTVAISIGSITNPELKIENGEYALKASGYFSAFDISLYGFYGFEKTPTLSYTGNNPNVYSIPESITVNGSYKRMTMIGLDTAFPIGELVIRAEGAYFPEREMQSSATSILAGGETSIKQHQIMGLAGIDWMPNGWTITAQYYCDYIFNKSDNLDREKAYQHGSTLSISKSFLNETLELSLSGLIGWNYFDSAISFEAAYSLSDQIGLSAGLFAFIPGPEKNGTYGNYKDLSTIYIKAEYKF